MLVLQSILRRSFLPKALLLLLFAQQQQRTSSATTTTTTTTRPLVPATDSTSATTLPWAGAWKFEKEWFAKQHPWLPGFLTRKVLASTLILGADYYHQIDHEGKALKEKRRLVVKNLTDTRAELIRHEAKTKLVHFHLERGADGHIYYVEEGLGEYRLVESDDESEQLAYKDGDEL